MKLNLLPGYIRQGKRNRTALLFMAAVTLVALLAFGSYSYNLKNELSTERGKTDGLTTDANAVVSKAAEADAIYQENSIVFRDMELAWYIEKHNEKYPELYRKVANRLPGYVRVLNMAATDNNGASGGTPAWPGMKGDQGMNQAVAAPPTQAVSQTPGAPGAPGGPGGSGAASGPSGTVTVVMQAVLGNYAQYSDVMISLARRGDGFVKKVSREGFYQNRAGADAGMGADNSGGRPAPPAWSTVVLRAEVEGNLVPPNPLAALVAAAGGGGTAPAGGAPGGAAPGGVPGSGEGTPGGVPGKAG